MRTVDTATPASTQHAAYWLRPPLDGAMLLFRIVRWRIVFALPILPFLVSKYGLRVFLDVGWVLIVATVAGAAGGLAFSVLQPLRARSLKLWAGLAGYASAAAYLAVALTGLSARAPETGFTSRQGLEAYGVCVLLFGFIMAAVYYDVAVSGGRRRKGARRLRTPAA